MQQFPTLLGAEAVRAKIDPINARIAATPTVLSLELTQAMLTHAASQSHASGPRMRQLHEVPKAKASLSLSNKVPKAVYCMILAGIFIFHS